ncbi:MAG: SDR family NAD(P)-dependent oxidoreductase, partial [Microthrixaceae bacterium]
MFDLSGRTALVTGAGQNVGAGIAQGLAAHGARVVVNDLRLERAESVVAEINATGGAEAIACVFDVTDHQAVKEATEQLPPVDILVNNAGVVDNMGITQFRDTTPADWDAMIRLNTNGVMNCCHAVLDP